MSARWAAHSRYLTETLAGRTRRRSGTRSLQAPRAHWGGGARQSTPARRACSTGGVSAARVSWHPSCSPLAAAAAAGTHSWSALRVCRSWWTSACRPRCPWVTTTRSRCHRCRCAGVQQQWARGVLWGVHATTTHPPCAPMASVLWHRGAGGAGAAARGSGGRQPLQAAQGAGGHCSWRGRPQLHLRRGAYSDRHRARPPAACARVRQ